MKDLIKIIIAAGIRGQPGGLDTPDLFDTIKNVTSALMAAAATVSAVAIIIGGVFYATASGDPGKAAKGKTAIIGGVIGLIISVSAFAIINFVMGAL